MKQLHRSVIFSNEISKQHSGPWTSFSILMAHFVLGDWARPVN